jgi:hypothetical protein
MTARRQTLRNRIINQPAASRGISRAPAAAPAAAGGGHPAVPGTPMLLPVAAVYTYPTPGNPYYVRLGLRDMQPIIAPDGRIIAATGPGQWGQLRQAGRP